MNQVAKQELSKHTKSVTSSCDFIENKHSFSIPDAVFLISSAERTLEILLL